MAKEKPQNDHCDVCGADWTERNPCGGSFRAWQPRKQSEDEYVPSIMRMFGGAPAPDVIEVWLCQQCAFPLLRLFAEKQLARVAAQPPRDRRPAKHKQGWKLLSNEPIVVDEGFRPTKKTLT